MQALAAHLERVFDQSDCFDENSLLYKYPDLSAHTHTKTHYMYSMYLSHNWTPSGPVGKVMYLRSRMESRA